jgi:hypothetical protein
MTPDQAAIMKATPPRRDQPDYRVVLFHDDDTAEVSPRLSYHGARDWAADRGAQINYDEHDNDDAKRSTTNMPQLPATGR